MDCRRISLTRSFLHARGLAGYNGPVTVTDIVARACVRQRTDDAGDYADTVRQISLSRSVLSMVKPATRDDLLRR
jgi:hypothetical protein